MAETTMAETTMPETTAPDRARTTASGTTAPDRAETAMHIEFGRLAAARKIMGTPSATGSLLRDRANAERWIARFGSPAEPGDGATAEAGEHSVILRPAARESSDRWIFYIHGGGMVYYSTAVFRSFLGSLAHDLHAPVEAFDYPKAPEHTVEHSVRLLTEHLAARCEALSDRELYLAGDSVGGLLALYLSLRDFPGLFSRIVLIYPVLDLHTERDSYRAYGEGYFLDGGAMRLFSSFLEPFFDERGFDPFVLSDDELAQLPECSVVTAGCDVLRDEGLAWARQLSDRSIGVRQQHFADLPHDFCLYSGRLGSARSAVARIAAGAFGLEGVHG